MTVGVLAAAGVAAVLASPAVGRPFTRADLAPAYLRFEAASAAGPIDEPTFRTLDRSFDAFTMRAFAGDFAAGRVALLAMTCRLEHGRPPTPLERAIGALCVDVDPPFVVRGTEDAPSLAVRSVVDVELESPLGVEGRLELRLEDGRVLAGPTLSLTFRDLEPIDRAAPFPRAWMEVPTGDHEVRFTAGGIASLPRRLPVDEASPRDRRARIRERLDAIGEDDALADAIAVCRARADLLAADPFGLVTAALVEPSVRFAREVASECAALERGDDPYRGRTDPHWRTFRLGRTAAPARVCAPATADDAARPLLIALHGAGADENLFFHGYGGGRLLELARERGIVVVTPRTEAVLRNEGTIGDLIDGVRADHAFDERRIWLLGHSMGAMTAMRRAAVDADRLAAVVCIAGAAPLDDRERCAPTLVVAGTADRIVPATGVVRLARAAIEAGHPVEVREEEGRGHTLFVPRVLPDALDWLAAYSR